MAWATSFSAAPASRRQPGAIKYQTAVPGERLGDVDRAIEAVVSARASALAE